MITIKSMQLKKYAIKLKRPFITNLHRQQNAEGYILALTVQSGDRTYITGYGEAVPSLKVTGDSVESIPFVINELIRPALLEKSFETPVEIDSFVSEIIVFNSAARLVVSEAVYDVFARQAEQPIAEYLGGTSQAVITDYTLSISGVDQMLTDAKDIVTKGFTDLKIKVGADSIANEINKLIKLHTELPNINFRIDANQAWTSKQTMAFIQKAIANLLPITFIEQPLKVGLEEELNQLAMHSEIPIMADESVFNHYQARGLFRYGAVKLINIKLEKAGSITEAQRIFEEATHFDVKIMLGCMIESKVGIAFAVALANANSYHVAYIDLDSPFMFSNDIVAEGLQLEQSCLVPSLDNGIGIEKGSFDVL
ncbi:dipeptide epimerase [Leuconostoc gelidum subsp. aenigmaticum]|uniref:dipeptide epimerase n=1 Tax=Leuconostoc gelidum TaxID=1244 RepID=UPI001CC3A17F|nr:dipeptide epimerase [Leuconostoc gelidum]MBZ6008301.1 dipeptide epimerase [Leuconostoc gelidum subsp. aenigmaticum]